MFPNVLDAIGCTPVVRLQRLAPAGIQLCVKLESLNPAGSLKDRLALGVIEAAERSGALRPGQTVVEASSGNTGIGLAMVCAAKGYPLVVVMAENFSVERRRLMRMLGARVVLTPAALKGSGMLAKARELAERHGWFWCRQFENPANAAIHARTTAQEILTDFRDQPLDWWVTGAGTGGSLLGIAGVLRGERPDCRIAVCEPSNAPMLASGIAQSNDASGQPSDSHPAFRPHPMQGWSPDFIPRLTEQARSRGLIDRVLPIDGEEALATARALARQEGILTGITGGATVAGALRLAAQAEPGTTLLCLLPDSAERYLSTPLFADIGDGMDDAEWAISRSTPGARFDVPLACAATAPVTDAAPDAEAAAFIDDALADRGQPVVFTLAWCEFGWAVRRLFDACGIAHRSVVLDAPALQAGRTGERIRAELGRRCAASTLPQVFIGGQAIGGCEATFAALADGRLGARLAAVGIALRQPPGFDAARLLPGWRQPAAAAHCALEDA